MKSIHFLFFLFISISSVAQVPFQLDTLTILDRIGSGLDSVDISNADYASSFDGGRCVNCPSGLSSTTFFNDITRPVFQPISKEAPLMFSGLPHLGFAYSFGGQGSQFIRANYIQAFRNSTILNVHYERNVGNGVLRRSSYNNNDVSLRLARRGIRYSFELKGYYQNNKLQNSGGIKTDTLITDFGLEFTPVRKLSAESSNTFGQVEWKNYINFSNDSVNQIGLSTFHKYSIYNRVYLEFDTLYGIYSAVNIDSFATRDQYNLPTVQNGVGLFAFALQNRIYGDVHFLHAYWDYQNLGMHQYTSEYSLKSTLGYLSRKVRIENRAYYNISGRYNEWSNSLSLKYSDKKVSVSGTLSLADVAIEPWQRKYFANQYNYNDDSLQNQFCVNSGVNATWNAIADKLSLSIFGNYHSIQNPYLVDDTVFRRDLIPSFDFGRIGIGVDFSHKIFHLNCRGIYSFDKGGYLPDYQVYARPYIETGVFKAKKLQMVFGLDFSYTTAFRLKAYIPSIDYFDWFAATSITSALTNLHAFVSFGIDEFRFYVRYENIGYFWNDRTIQIMDQYPLAGTRLRVGITWDFFN